MSSEKLKQHLDPIDFFIENFTTDTTVEDRPVASIQALTGNLGQLNVFAFELVNYKQEDLKRASKQITSKIDAVLGVLERAAKNDKIYVARHYDHINNARKTCDEIRQTISIIKDTRLNIGSIH